MENLRKQFDYLGMRDILEVILQGSEQSDLAMWYVLNIRMSAMLYEQYEKFKTIVGIKFVDTLVDFLLYLRDGAYQRNRMRYESLHRIKHQRQLGRWLISAYTFYLSNIVSKECHSGKRLISLDRSRIRYRLFTDDELKDDECMVKMAAKVIAFVYQKMNVENRVVMMSWLMSKYKKDCPHSPQEIAAMMGISGISFRTRVHRIIKNLHRAHIQLMATDTLPLDEEHLRLSETIEESFNDLSPLFLRYYELNLFIKTGIIMS